MKRFSKTHSECVHEISEAMKHFLMCITKFVDEIKSNLTRADYAVMCHWSQF